VDICLQWGGIHGDDTHNSDLSADLAEGELCEVHVLLAGLDELPLLLNRAVRIERLDSRLGSRAGPGYEPNFQLMDSVRQTQLFVQLPGQGICINAISEL